MEIVPSKKVVYGVNGDANRRAADSDVKYSIQNHASSHKLPHRGKRLAPKSKIQNQEDVTKRSADAPPKRGGDSSEAVED